jgi:hypothetical protein
MNESTWNSDPDKVALRQFLAEIDARYPLGWFVAIEDGNVIAASADFHEVVNMLVAQGRNPRDTMVVEAGARRPEYITILL